MMKINLGNLSSRAEEITSFLEKRIGYKPSVESNSILIDETKLKKKLKPKDIKTYMKRYLYYKNERKSYKLYLKKDEIDVVEIEEEKEQEE